MGVEVIGLGGVFTCERMEEGGGGKPRLGVPPTGTARVRGDCA